LDALRLEATMDRIDADLALGKDAALSGELESLIARHPLVERLRGQLMLGQYRAGRQADALETFQTTRTVLAEELGLPPGPQLRELERRILQHDPSLMLKPRGAQPQSVSRRLLVALGGLVGAAAAGLTAFLLIGGGGGGGARVVGTDLTDGGRLM